MEKCPFMLLIQMVVPVSQVFACFDTICPSQQFFSHVGKIFCLPRLKK